MTARPHETIQPSTAPYADIAQAFDELAERSPTPRRPSRGYHRLVDAVLRSIVRPGASVLEIGSGAGDALAGVEPARGVGVDVSPGMVKLARSRHPGLRFGVASGEELALEETFDYIVLSDLVPYVDDLLALFQNVAAHSTADTRIVVNSYSQLWRPILAVLELLRRKERTPIRTWMTIGDV